MKIIKIKVPITFETAGRFIFEKIPFLKLSP